MDFQGALWDGHKGNYLGNGHNGMATRDTKGLFRELFRDFSPNFVWEGLDGFGEGFARNWKMNTLL